MSRKYGTNKIVLFPNDTGPALPVPFNPIQILPVYPLFGLYASH